MTNQERKIRTIAVLAITVIAALLLFKGTADANDVIQPQEVSLTYRNFFPGGRDPLVTQNGLPDRGLGQGLVLTLDSDVLDYFFWNNQIHSTTDKYADTDTGGQFRTIGWQFEVGARLTQWLDIAYHHHSQHVLDTTLAFGEWPVEDALQIKIYFYRARTRDGLFSF